MFVGPDFDGEHLRVRGGGVRRSRRFRFAIHYILSQPVVRGAVLQKVLGHLTLSVLVRREAFASG
eukprot:11167708-Lingulodinium_polyedra.AAC.1